MLGEVIWKIFKLSSCTFVRLLSEERKFISASAAFLKSAFYYASLNNCSYRKKNDNDRGFHNGT